MSSLMLDSLIMGEPGTRENATLVFRDHDGIAKAIPFSTFLDYYQLEDFHGPTPLECLALKERLMIADDHWKYVTSVFRLCM